MLFQILTGVSNPGRYALHALNGIYGTHSEDRAKINGAGNRVTRNSPERAVILMTFGSLKLPCGSAPGRKLFNMNDLADMPRCYGRSLGGPGHRPNFRSRDSYANKTKHLRLAPHVRRDLLFQIGAQSHRSKWLQMCLLRVLEPPSLASAGLR